MQTDVVLIGCEGLGSGDRELGGLILANFLRILGERSEVPQYLILWNEAVKMAVDGSLWIAHLRTLQERGVKIISCRTCVEYFGLEEAISVGEISTMHQIQEILLTHKVLTV